MPEQLRDARRGRALAAGVPRGTALGASWLLLAVLYVACAFLGVLGWRPLAEGMMDPFCFAAGAGFAALLIFGLRLWPGIWLGALVLAVVVHHAGGAAALAFASGHTLALAAGAGLLRRLRGDSPWLDSLPATWHFLWAGGVLVPLLAAGPALLLSPAAVDAPLAHYFTLVFSIAGGVFLMAPLLLAWGAPREEPLRPGWWLEAVSVWTFTVLSAAVATGWWPVQGVAGQPLTFLVAPALVWGVLRLQLRGVAVALILIALLLQWSMVHGTAPFVMTGAPVAQLYLLVLAVCTLVACAVLEERGTARAQALLGEQIIRQTAEGVMVTTPEERIVAVNPAFSRTTGYSAEEVIGKTPAILRSGLHDDAFYREMKRALRREGRWRGEIRNRRKNGEVYAELLSISLLRDDRGAPYRYVGMFSDLSQQPHIRERIHRLAYYDTLTRLPNRQLFMDRLEQALIHARREGWGLALLFIDLDRFKEINDTHGHPYGDRVLQILAERLESCLRADDTCARLGGDEFTVLLLEVNSVRDLAQVVAKIRHQMDTPFEIEGRLQPVSVSIGAALFPRHGEDPATLLSHADRAMYAAKHAGRDTFRIYQET